MIFDDKNSDLFYYIFKKKEEDFLRRKLHSESKFM